MESIDKYVWIHHCTNQIIQKYKKGGCCGTINQSTELNEDIQSG